MTRRVKKLIAFVLVAAQLLLAVPAIASAHVPATTIGHAAHGSSMHCDDMPAPSKDDSCPCCPDGSHSQDGCMASCMLGAVIAPAVLVLRSATPENHPPVVDEFGLDTLSDPPLKPPPIA